MSSVARAARPHHEGVWRDLLLNRPWATAGGPGPTLAALRVAAGALLGQECRRLRPPLHAPLGENRAHVVLDRLLQQVDDTRDLAIGLALGDHAQDAPLLLRQIGERVRPPMDNARMRANKPWVALRRCPVRSWRGGYSCINQPAQFALSRTL